MLENIHIGLAIGSILVTALLAYVGLKIRLEVSDSKSEILTTTASIANKLDTHVQLDEAKHREIDKHLEFTDKRVDAHDIELRKRVRG